MELRPIVHRCVLVLVLDPSLMGTVDVFPCEDGHAQERSLLVDVLPSVEARDVQCILRIFVQLSFCLESLNKPTLSFGTSMLTGIPS